MREINLKEIRAETTKKQGYSISEVNTFFDTMSSYSVGRDISLVIYFICLKTLSEAMGKLKNRLCRKTEDGVEEVTDSKLNELINIRPNPYMTASMFYSTVEYHRNHYGNAYVYCRRDMLGQPVDLWILHPDCVSILIDNKGWFESENAIWIRYTDIKTAETYLYPYSDVCHYRTSLLSSDGISGLPIRDILRSTIDLAKQSQSMQQEVYKNGVTGKAVLEYTGDLNENLRTSLAKKVEELASGAKNYGKIVPIPLGMKLTPLNVSLSDLQFLDIRKYTNLQIAAAFGLKPNQINDYGKSSYNNSESQNISFYVDTLLYILQQYEQEETYKLLSEKDRKDGYFIKRNVKGIFRTDTKQQIESLRTAVSNGIQTVNEARAELDLPKKAGGDRIIVNGTYIGLEDVGKQYQIATKEGD